MYAIRRSVDIGIGGIKCDSGRILAVPVIYVNATNLSVSLDPVLINTARHVSSVIQHECTHFLGFRHSAEQSSLLAPAGTGSIWAEDDKAIFAEYLKYFK